jgi:probable HAF family extracellular repeat protein
MKLALTWASGFAVLAAAGLVGCRDLLEPSRRPPGHIAFVNVADPNGNVLTLGGCCGVAMSVNDAGVVVGWSQGATGPQRPFRWTQAGGIEDLIPSALGGFATDVSANGVIVGLHTDAAFRLGLNGLEILQLLPGTTSLGGSVAWAVNSSGVTVGSAFDGTSPAGVAVMWQANGGLTSLGNLGGSAEARDINDSGVVVGRGPDATGTQVAWKWSGSGLVPLPLPFGGASAAFGINNAGRIVGDMTVANGETHAVIWETDGTVRDLQTLGGNLSAARGINQLGQVVGFSRDSAGVMRGFVWDSIDVMLQLEMELRTSGV